MTEQEALKRMKGKTIKNIEHHEIIGSVQVHFTDGCSIQIFAQEKADQQVTIFEPNK